MHDLKKWLYHQNQIFFIDPQGEIAFWFTDAPIQKVLHYRKEQSTK